MADGTLKVGTITTSSGSGTITLGQSGETVTIPTGATITNSGTANGFGGANTPMFKASMSGNQSIANETFVKGAFNTEIFDTNSAYDTSNYRFTVPSGKDGKYCFVSLTAIDNLDSGEAQSSAYYINGSIDNLSYNTQWVSKGTNGFGVVNNVFIKTLAAGNYVELFVSHNEGASQNLSATYSSFSGYKLIT